MSNTVLIIEDDPGTVDFITDALEMDGYRTVHAVDSEGIAVARAEQPAVILLDLNMRGMDGPEVSQHLRAEKATANIPIVSMSAHCSTKALPPDLLSDEHLSKPFNLNELLDTVARWAERTSSQTVR